MNGQLVDVTIHVDENLDMVQRNTVDQQLRGLDGVISVHNADKTPHLVTIEYDPQAGALYVQLREGDIAETVEAKGD